MSEKLSFACTPDGAIEAGRRRMAWVFGALGAASLTAALFALRTRQIFAAVLSLGVALGVFVIYQMSRELNPAELVIEGDTLSILMRRALRRLPLSDARVRRLTADEIDHLARLATSGGFVAGAGGFDSHILGEFDLYASRLENAVLLETEDGRVVVTPDLPEQFVAAVSVQAS